MTLTGAPRPGLNRRNSVKTLKIGSLVKSLDFHSHPDCFYIGVVKSIDANDGTFTAETIGRWFEGRPLKVELPPTFTAPLEGNHFFDDPSRPRVIILDGAAA